MAPGSSSNLAAEFYVASLLYRQGYTATLTLGHTKEIDIMVFDERTKRTATIDVKGLKNTTNWVMPSEGKLGVWPGHFYALVTFKNKIEDPETVPEVYFVPSKMVKELWSSWSGRPDVKGITYSAIRKHPELKGSEGTRRLFRPS